MIKAALFRRLCEERSDAAIHRAGTSVRSGRKRWSETVGDCHTRQGGFAMTIFFLFRFCLARFLCHKKKPPKGGLF